MLNKNRFLLIAICFIFVIFIPWHIETVLPAEIVATTKIATISKKRLQEDFNQNTNNTLIDKQSNTVLKPEKKFEHFKVLSTENIHLNCCTSTLKGMEIFSGQNAIFFPETDNINPFHIFLTRLTFKKGEVYISGTPFRNNQFFEGKIKGLIAIKGERKSLIMRIYNYFFNSRLQKFNKQLA
ncbi:MAG: hypothetical protein H6492_01810 [Candidatus Paracaedibacteraceae bacterium]|nr:hypothetical protein [Candidatus Paracaedibacteraceae bacterium]